MLRIFKFKKQLITAILISILSLILVVLAYYFLRQDNYKIVVNENELISLDINHDEESKGLFGYSAGLPWYSGEIDAKVISSEIYDEVTEVKSLSNDELSYIVSQNMDNLDNKFNTDFMIINIEIKNINAILIDPKIPDDEFLINFFNPTLQSVFNGEKINMEYYISDCVYFDKHESFEILKKSNYKNYFYLDENKFKQGETLLLKLGFYIDEKTASENNIVLKIGVSDKYKYGIALDLKRK